MIVNKLKDRGYYEAYICKKCGATFMKQVILGRYGFHKIFRKDDN